MQQWRNDEVIMRRRALDGGRESALTIAEPKVLSLTPGEGSRLEKVRPAL